MAEAGRAPRGGAPSPLLPSWPAARTGKGAAPMATAGRPPGRGVTATLSFPPGWRHPRWRRAALPAAARGAHSGASVNPRRCPRARRPCRRGCRPRHHGSSQAIATIVQAVVPLLVRLRQRTCPICHSRRPHPDRHRIRCPLRASRAVTSFSSCGHQESGSRLSLLLLLLAVRGKYLVDVAAASCYSVKPFCGMADVPPLLRAG
jgi:hypothetical protein